MGWETRNGNRYYYRKRRQGGRVVSEYVGSGDLAGLASELDDIERQQREAERDEWRRQVQADRELDQEIAALAEQVKALTAAALLASGCHKPWRKWRVMRG